jgi:hypothetical protein
MQQQQQLQRPQGCRAELYRLNSDGSWDFCGRGWIQLVFARPRQQPQQRQQRDVIFHLLGEPMLRMHDEKYDKIILLRTRVILLPNAYQLVEGNIFWYDPFNDNNMT